MYTVYIYCICNCSIFQTFVCGCIVHLLCELNVKVQNKKNNE